MFEAYGAYGYLIAGATVLAVIGVIASIIEQKYRRPRQAGGVTTMVEFPAMVEQAGDGTWTAAIVEKHSVLGTGASREEALEDLRKGVGGLVEYLKHSPQSSASK